MLVKSKFLLSARSGLQKQLQQNKFPLISLIALFVLVGIFALNGFNFKKITSDEKNLIVSTPTPSPTPTPTPTPKPLTFAEMNALYGPCVRMPVLMYHHVQTQEAATTNKQTSLTVNTDMFEKQMQYLKDRGYNAASANDLVNFFDNGTPITPKSVLITFDDAYSDIATDAYPILSKMGFAATVFVPTGLAENPGYMTWTQMDSLKSLILFANHTWSHKNVGAGTASMQYEISTADLQLADHGLNSPKVFAYPYGFDTVASAKYLDSLGYKAAFTTVPGNILCKKQRFSLPRIRIGNILLSNYGF